MQNQTNVTGASIHPIVHMPVAVLCVASNSIYKQIAGIEVYDQTRDARTYTGGMPVVAHPPCRAWSAYCRHQAKPGPGEKDLAPWCVSMVKENGGVLEHPAHSRLWDELGLPRPGERPVDGLWAMKVQQSWWGDKRSKNTWLLIAGLEPKDLPEVPFRLHDPRMDREQWNTMSKHQRAATPPAFAQWLIEVARATRIGGVVGTR
jgi:hypothetical protein